MNLRIQTEPHIEVYRFHVTVVVGVAFFALLLQAYLPVLHPRLGEWLELPLLVTLYFGLSRRNPSTGLMLGMSIGLLQDAVGGTFLGLYGIAKTLVGYGASSVGGRIDVEHPLARLVLAFVFFHVHQLAFALTNRLLVAEPTPYFTMSLLVASMVNAVVAVALFPLLDRLRKS